MGEQRDERRYWRCRACGHRLGVIEAGAVRLLVLGVLWSSVGLAVRCPKCRSRECYRATDLAA